MSLLLIVACSSTVSIEPVPADARLRGVFEGTTPCNHATRPLPQIPTDAECEQIIWKIALYEDRVTGNPTTYRLSGAYGVPRQETPHLVRGGTVIAMQGDWTIARGSKADPDAVVYQLNVEGHRPAVSLLGLSDDVLHVMSRERDLLVGNPSWSYTRSRTDNRSAPVVGHWNLEPETSAPRPSAPAAPRGSVVSGIFEGRLPCHTLVFEITEQEPYACEKTKSRLTLYRDAQTGAPSVYLFHAVGRRAATLYRQGIWMILRGRPGEANATIYQLAPAGARPISLLKADDNHLFLLDRSLNVLAGNARFSYTLSRVDK